MAANLTGNSGWKQTPNPAIKQRLNWAVTTGNSTNNKSTVVVSFWLKKDPNIQNLPTTSTDCRFKIECGGQIVSNSNIDSHYSSSMTLPATNTEMCVARHTFTITHNQDGTKSINIKVSGGFGGTSITYYQLSVSKSLTLPSIQRASVISSVTNVVIGNNPNVVFTPYSKNFYYKLKFVYDGNSYTVGSSSSPIHPNTTSAYTYNGFTVPLELINNIINAESVQMMVYLYTYSDSGYTKQIGNSSSKKFNITIPSNIVPTVDSFTCEDTPLVNGLYADGYVDFVFTVTASGIYGSSITSVIITQGSNIFTQTNITDNGDNTYTCTLSIEGYKAGLTKDSYVTFFCSVIDSRGRSSGTAGAYSIAMCAYADPTIKLFNVERDSTNATTVNVWLNASGSSLRIRNVLRCMIYYREYGTTEWISAGYLQPDNPTFASITINGKPISTVGGDVFEENKTYEIKACVYDSIGAARDVGITVISYIGVSDVLIDFRAGGKGLGIGKMAESDSVEISFPTKFYNTRTKVIDNTEYRMNDMIDSYTYITNELENNFVPYYISGFVNIRKIGNIVNICGEISSTVDISSDEMHTGKRFLSLTAPFTPLSNIYTMCQGSGKNTWLLTVNTDGEMIFSRYGTSSFTNITGKNCGESGRVWLPFNVTYLADNSVPASSYYRENESTEQQFAYISPISST